MNSILNNFAIRIGIVAGIVVLTHFGLVAVRAGNAPPEVAQPTDSLDSLPKDLGDWHGEDVNLDPQTFVGTEARNALSRIYTHQGQKASVFVAFYEDPTAALFHNPGNCYRGSGWTLLQSSKNALTSSHRPQQIEVSVSEWQRQGDKAVVLYWYEVGNLTLFGRSDLWDARWAFRGQKVWPPIFKVLIQVSSSDPDSARKDALELAGRIRDWLGIITPSSGGGEASAS